MTACHSQRPCERLPERQFCALRKRKDPLLRRHGNPVFSLLIRENDDSLRSLKRVAVWVRVAPGASLRNGQNADISRPRASFKYLFYLDQVASSWVAVDDSLAVFAHRSTDHHRPCLVVLGLRGVKPNPINARFSATGRNNATPAPKHSHQGHCLHPRNKLPHGMKLRRAKRRHHSITQGATQMRPAAGVGCRSSICGMSERNESGELLQQLPPPMARRYAEYKPANMSEQSLPIRMSAATRSSLSSARKRA